MKLNIGAGDTVIEGYEPIDRKIGKEAFPLDVADESCEEIRASHILEHFANREVFEVLKNWYAKLKPGGTMKIAVPNFSYIASHYNNGSDNQLLRAYATGGQTDDNDFHRSSFDFDTLHTLMSSLGLHSIRPWRSDIEDCASLDVSLNLQGTKPTRTPFPFKLHAVMSTPRLGFMENMFTVVQIIAQRGISLTKTTGAWWHHCLERVAEDAINQGIDWLITLDYDTVCTEDQFEHMGRLVAKYHDEIDALAPWQVKRESNEALAWLDDGNGGNRKSITVGEMYEDLHPARTAHFGLTWIKASALRSLPHPWFHEIPDADGKWGEGRHDPDIYFWKHFREHGFKLCMANQVGIGHLQQMVSWPGRNLRPQHQYLTDFQKHGMPAGVIK